MVDGPHIALAVVNLACSPSMGTVDACLVLFSPDWRVQIPSSVLKGRMLGYRHLPSFLLQLSSAHVPGSLPYATVPGTVSRTVVFV